MSERILFVDDDPSILGALERALRRDFTICTAIGSELGLQKLEQAEPFAVVVADRQMPGMDGIQFLTAVRDKSPHSVRLMLTGNADLETTIRLVNESGIFRFLTKPCAALVLTKALQDALTQHRLIIAERELIDRTLKGSIKVLVDMLAMVAPDAFARGRRLRDRIEILTKRMGLASSWELHLAALLGPIGMVTLPPEVAVKVRRSQSLTPAEQSVLERVPEIGRNLLVNIPRLQNVAQIIYYQDKCYDGSSFPVDRINGQKIPIGSRVIKLLNDLAEIEARGRTPAEALQLMRDREGWYDPTILEVAGDCFGHALVPLQDMQIPHISVGPDQLCAGHVVYAKIETTDGQLVVPTGQVITEPILEKIRNFARLEMLRLPILVEDQNAVPEVFA